jgi:hypothetical protein
VCWSDNIGASQKSPDHWARDCAPSKRCLDGPAAVGRRPIVTTSTSWVCRRSRRTPLLGRHRRMGQYQMDSEPHLAIARPRSCWMWISTTSWTRRYGSSSYGIRSAVRTGTGDNRKVAERVRAGAALRAAARRSFYIAILPGPRRAAPARSRRVRSGESSRTLRRGQVVRPQCAGRAR